MLSKGLTGSYRRRAVAMAVAPQRALLVIVIGWAVLLSREAVNGDVYEECGDQIVRMFIASNESCSHYIYCDGDNSYDGVCNKDDDGEDLYFNEIAQICDRKEFVECALDNVTMTTMQNPVTDGVSFGTPTAAPPPLTAPSPPPPTTAAAAAVPPVTATTTTTTTTTTTPQPQPQPPPTTIATTIATTQPTLTTNISTNTNSLTTTKAAATATTAATTTTTTTTNNNVRRCPAVDNPSEVIFLSHPKSCSDYFLCFNGEPLPMHCSPMLHFNMKSGKCDYPENAKCRITNATPQKQCQSHTVDLYPHPNNCNYFYYCKNGYLLLQQCPFFFGWDYQKRTCVALNQAQCYSNRQRF